MFGLIRFAISLAMIAAFIWFAVTVPLGKRTLWGHLHAIFATQEAKDLADGTKQEAEKVAHKVRDELHAPDMVHAADERTTTGTQDTASPSPRRDLEPAGPRPKAHRVKVPLPAN